ncbi:MAG: hypothetical protein ACI9WU_005191 [Myxococcota bacterium]|jgi:hypothetical protein
MKSCHACGKAIGSKAGFCPYCGALPRRRQADGGAWDSSDQDEPAPADKTVALQVTPEMLAELERAAGPSPAPAAPAPAAPSGAKRRATTLGMASLGLRGLAARQSSDGDSEPVPEPAPAPQAPAPGRKPRRSPTLMGAPGTTLRSLAEAKARELSATPLDPQAPQPAKPRPAAPRPRVQPPSVSWEVVEEEVEESTALDVPQMPDEEPMAREVDERPTQEALPAPSSPPGPQPDPDLLLSGPPSVETSAVVIPPEPSVRIIVPNAETAEATQAAAVEETGPARFATQPDQPMFDPNSLPTPIRPTTGPVAELVEDPTLNDIEVDDSGPEASPRYSMPAEFPAVPDDDSQPVAAPLAGLPALSAQPRALIADLGKTPASFFGRIGYLKRARKARSAIKRARRIIARRAATLTAERSAVALVAGRDAMARRLGRDLAVSVWTQIDAASPGVDTAESALKTIDQSLLTLQTAYEREAADDIATHAAASTEYGAAKKCLDAATVELRDLKRTVAEQSRSIQKAESRIASLEKKAADGYEAQVQDLRDAMEGDLAERAEVEPRVEPATTLRAELHAETGAARAAAQEADRTVRAGRREYDQQRQAAERERKTADKALSAARAILDAPLVDLGAWVLAETGGPEAARLSEIEATLSSDSALGADLDAVGQRVDLVAVKRGRIGLAVVVGGPVLLCVLLWIFLPFTDPFGLYS